MTISSAFQPSLGLSAASKASFTPCISPIVSPLFRQTSRRTRLSHAQSPTAKLADIATLEDTFVSNVTSLRDAAGFALHQYAKKAPQQFSKAITAIEALESTNTGFGSSFKKLNKTLVGNWRLVLTDSEAVVKNSGSITGLGNLPFAQCLCVNVVLEKDGKAKTIEKVKVMGGVSEGENTLTGKWSVDKDVLNVTYANAVLMGRMTLRADSKAVLKTTYCSDNIRVGRSQSGDVYAFIKE